MTIRTEQAVIRNKQQARFQFIRDTYRLKPGRFEWLFHRRRERQRAEVEQTFSAAMHNLSAELAVVIESFVIYEGHLYLPEAPHAGEVLAIEYETNFATESSRKKNSE